MLHPALRRVVKVVLVCTSTASAGCSSDTLVDTVEYAVSTSPSTPTEPPIPPAPSPLHGHCFRLSLIGDRFLDAYTTQDGDVVTRTYQNNDTQAWCFTQLAGEDVFSIQHRSFLGQFLDAYTSGSDKKATLRDRQQDGTQDWQVDYDGTVYRIEQISTGRHLEAKPSAAEDYRVVTRSPWETAWGQRWMIGPL